MSSGLRQPVLSPRDHEFFIEHGYLILKNAVPAEIVARAVATLEQGAFQGEPGAANYRAVRDADVDACVTDTILDAVGEIFGPDNPFERRRRASDMPRPYEPDKPWWHQTVHVDDDFPTLMPGTWAVSFFIFLTPLKSHGGAFLYAPDAPRRFRTLLSDNPEWPLFYEARPKAAGDALEYLAEPGDVLFFHHLMAHAGSRNVSDPRTRHALLARWHPRRRIVPGFKPFEEMATIEKANSARYLHALSGASEPPPGLPTEMAAESLRDGLSLPGGIAAHASLRCEGETHVFYASPNGAGVIRHIHSRDWAAWEEGTPVEGIEGPVGALSLFRQGPHILLFAGTTGSDPHTRILNSSDLCAWAPIATLGGKLGASGHTTTDYGSKRARGNVVVSVPTDKQEVVQAHWGADWEQATGLANALQIGRAPEATTIVDAFVRPILGEGTFVLMADVLHDGVCRPFYARSDDSLDYADPLTPLPYTAPAPPRQVRVYTRARNYWLVTYARHQAGEERLFWGSIDWEREEPILEEITGTAALRAALAVVGIL
jgi:hypothetical protein